MREALSMLIDRAYIVENIARTAQTAANSYIPIGMSDGNGGLFRADPETGYFDPYAINEDFDGTVAIARELLRYAGYEFGEDGRLSAETPISIRYLTNDSAGQIAVAKSIQQDLVVLGITMSIQALHRDQFLEERKNGNFDFARGGRLADYNDPVNFLEAFITVSGNNDCKFGE